MLDSVLCEVRVDRLNEKGVFVAEQILNILHNTQEIPGKTIFGKRKKQRSFIPFTFEIANVGGVIRFFFSTPREYLATLQNQIYAHFPNVEFHVVEEYFPDTPAYVVDLSLSKEYFLPLKIYTDLKDRSEKETVDPLSSFTSALSKAPKDQPVLLQVCFSPIIDEMWKDQDRIDIFLSKRPKWLKKLLLSRHGTWLNIITVPFSLILKFIALVVRGSHADEHGGETAHSEKPSDLEAQVQEKTKSYGYGVSIRAATFVQDPALAKSLLREIATSLMILGRPNGNSLKIGDISQKDSLLKQRKNERKLILNSAELAGIIHMPTIYVKTPGINWVVTKKFEPPANLPISTGDDDVTPVGMTNFRGTDTPF